MNILALDPATNCGWAHSSGASGTWDLSIRRDESSGMRLLRLKSKLNACLDAGVDLLVYEAARNAGPKMQGALVVQATLQGVIVLWAEEKCIDYRGYSPREIKKHATGKGNANKDSMLAAARQRGWHPADDNEADALWILDLARSEYGN
jgi:Holliday junction resolvasome RuvABC endonuclease subunit